MSKLKYLLLLRHLFMGAVILSGSIAYVNAEILPKQGMTTIPVVTDSRITGTVVDQNGESVIGANVSVKGTTNGTITDMDGKFSLTVPDGAVLLVSYIGYLSQEIPVANQTSFRIVLLEDTQTLDEVVVVGFGTQKKVNVTGAVAVVGGEELAQRPVTSAAQALQGLVPGLQIASSIGTLDSNPEISVRGVGTIGEGSSGAPLILIDGVEGDINSLTTQDIENISVLKDAAASSIYGSRAPFGVILITTKTGTEGGRLSINYNNSFRIGTMINEKHMMNSVDFASWMNDAHTNAGQLVFFDEARMEKIAAYHNGTEIGPGTRQTSMGVLYAIDADANGNWLDGYANGIDDVDWYDAIYRNSTFSQAHNASISGGNENLNYYASFNYIGNRGFMKLAEDTYSRYNASAKLGVKLSDWARLNYSMRYIRSNYKRPSQLTGGLYDHLTRQGWPVLPLYDRNGYYFHAPSWALALAERGDDRSESDVMNHQVGLVLEPVKNWVTHIDFNYRANSWMNHWDLLYGYNHDIDGNPAIVNSTSEAHESLSKDNYMNFQAYSAYSLSLAEKHNFHVMAGFQAEQLRRTEFGVTRAGIIDPNKPEVDLTSGLSYDGAVIIPGVHGRHNQWQTAGFFGRINYNFMERYLFEANLRYDGTSRFRADNMWKLFPSFSFGWRIKEESFLKEKEWISNLKLRLSYGSLGNQNTNNWYQTYQTVSYTSNNGEWLQNGSRPNTSVAPGLVSTLLTWEKIESYNVGIDFGFLNNKLWGNLDYFIRDTKDMVGNAPELPSILGTNVPVTNNTDLRTSGWEFQIGWRDQLSNGLSYGATFNLADARTKITRYPNNPTGDLGRFLVGRYTNDIWGYETIGIAKSQEEMDAHLAKVDQSYLGSNWSAGDIMYADLDENGRIGQGANTLTDHGDKKVLGNSTPRFHFGLDLNASWKGFDVRMFFQGLMKHDIWTGGSSQWLFGANGSVWDACGLTSVQDYYRDENTWSVENGYREANQDAWLPRVALTGKNTQAQSHYILNAAYMRLKNFQFGYTIPQSITTKAGIKNLRVFFSGENLFTFTALPEQFDPETVGDSNSRNNGYPLSTTYSFGLNIQF